MDDKKEAIKAFLINHFNNKEIIDYSKDPIEWLNKKDENGNNPLFVACQLDNCIAIDIFKVYPDAIKQQSDWSGHRNPFHVACFNSTFIPLLRLIRKEANTLIHEIDSDGRTPLFFAQPKLFKWLRREAKVNFNIQDSYGQTAFHYNCIQLNYGYCDQLLKVDGIQIDVNLLDKNGNNPLFSLIIKMINESKIMNKEHWDRAISIISIINNKNYQAKYHALENNENLLHYICKNYDKHGQIPNNITKSIINNFISLINKGDINGITPVHLACQCKHDFVKNLLESPYSSNRIYYSGRTALHQALYGTPYGQDTNNEMNKNIFINQTDNSGRTALNHACEFHNYDAFINIIKFKELNLNLVDEGQNTALHAIVANNERYCEKSILMIKHLLKTSPHMIYQINGSFDTAISIINKLINPIVQPHINIAPINDQPQPNINIGLKIMKILKDAHTESINTPDDKGNTPFHFACKPRPGFELIQITHLLAEPTLEKNVRNIKGRTAFHDACFYSTPWLISRLMNLPEININITDKGGENALHHVIQGYIKNPRNDDCLETIHILLRTTPFLVNMKNSAFETPLHYVRLMNKDRGGLICIKMNGKDRKIYCQGIDRRFWATLLTTLEHYQKQARLDIFNYFMEINFIN